MERIYRWLYAWAEKKIRQCAKSDQKCEHCLRWYSVAGCKSWSRTDNTVVDEAICGGCGKTTKWFMGSMLPLWLSDISKEQPHD